MTSWSEGYVNSSEYSYGYFNALNPNGIVIPFLMAGIAPPKITHACELGFGQGLSVTIHAMAGTPRWFGTDFNPAHAAFARHMAEMAGIDEEKAHLSEQGFNEFCLREDLPDFDFIGLHGIWSWVSDDNRRIIVDFVRRKLKPGGVLYVSYNSLPGWAYKAPIRHLLAEFHQQMAMGAQNDQDSIMEALHIAGEVLQNSMILTKISPSIIEQLNMLMSKDPAYLVHEYLNKDWQPMYFSEVEKYLSEAKMNYACSATFAENFNPCLFNAQQMAFFESIENPSFAQTVKDFIINQQFRCDYWVKGKRQLNNLEIEQEWDNLRVMLTTKREDYSPTIKSISGSIDILAELTDPVLDILADGKIHAVAALRKALQDRLDKERLFMSLGLLFAKGDIVVCNSDEQIAAQRKACQRFNKYVLEQSQTGDRLAYLASPVTGGGVHVDMVDQLFLLAQILKMPQDQWVPFAWKMLQAQGRSMLKDGKKLEGEAENLEQIREHLAGFQKDRLKLLRNLQCVA